MAAKYELYQDKQGEYRWRLRHQNGNIIADSAEGYSSKAAALNGIESVKKNVGDAEIKEIAAAEPEVKAAPAVEAEPKSVIKEEPVLVTPQVKQELTPPPPQPEPEPIPLQAATEPEPAPIQPQAEKEPPQTQPVIPKEQVNEAPRATKSAPSGGMGKNNIMIIAALILAVAFFICAFGIILAVSGG